MVQYSERSLLPWISCCSRKLQPKSDAVCFLMVPHVHEHTCCKNGRMRTHTHIPTYPHYTYVFFLLFVSDLQLYYIERSKCWLSLRVGRYETLGLRSGLLDTHYSAAVRPLLISPAAFCIQAGFVTYCERKTSFDQYVDNFPDAFLAHCVWHFCANIISNYFVDFSASLWGFFLIPWFLVVYRLVSHS